MADITITSTLTGGVSASGSLGSAPAPDGGPMTAGEVLSHVAAALDARFLNVKNTPQTRGAVRARAMELLNALAAAGRIAAAGGAELSVENGVCSVALSFTLCEDAGSVTVNAVLDAGEAAV